MSASAVDNVSPMREFKKPVRKPTRQMSVSRVEPPPPGPAFRVVYIGAGGINFGTDEGPWNHSFRVENKLGTRLVVTALIDPFAASRERVLKIKRDSFVERAYKDTKEYDSVDAYLADLKPEDHPHAVIIGSPPHFHGSTEPGKDVEVQLTKAIPGVALFVEKPVTMSSVDECKKVARILEKQGTICSVGYMFRYLAAVQKMKELLADKTVSGVVARYICSYAKITKANWWTFSLSGGAVVEQATHFADLCRFFGGEVDLDSIQANQVEPDSPAGQLSVVPVDESKIAPHDRIARMTSATWQFEKTGAIGSLTHGLLLQGTKYDTTLEVYADGWQLRLVDPYEHPRLYVRSPHGDDHEQTFTFPEDDPYFTEIDCFIDAIEHKDQSHIASSFSSGVKTYEFTWAITNAARRAKQLRDERRAARQSQEAQH